MGVASCGTRLAQQRPWKQRRRVRLRSREVAGQRYKKDDASACVGSDVEKGQPRRQHAVRSRMQLCLW